MECECCGEEIDKVLCPACARQEPEDVVDFFNRDGNQKIRNKEKPDGWGFSIIQPKE